MIKQLSREEQDRLHHRYRESDLFRQWSPLLCRLEWELQELDGISLWWEADKALQQLRQTQKNRDEMIPHIFRRLLSDFRRVKMRMERMWFVLLSRQSNLQLPLCA